jgi:hypothetical protein
MNNEVRYVPSPTEVDYANQDAKLLNYGKKLSNINPRILPPLTSETRDGGPNSFKYIEGLLFSTRNVEFKNNDIPMTEEKWLGSIRNRPLLKHNVIKFNRNHNIRSFEFILSYSQLNRWAGNTYEPIAITKQFKGSLLFTGCSYIYDKDLGERLPMELHARYELIGDSLGEGDAIDEFGGNKGGPRIIFTYTYDLDNVYVYISDLYPVRLAPVGAGYFEDISMGDDTGNFTFEKKRQRLIEKDHIKGIKEEDFYIRDAVTYCDVTISLKDTTIGNRDEPLEFIPINDIDTDILEKNSQQPPPKVVACREAPKRGHLVIRGLHPAARRLPDTLRTSVSFPHPSRPS